LVKKGFPFLDLSLTLSRVPQIGKLNVYRNAGEDELLSLHPSDRLMVKLIEIDRLAPRVNGMLFRTRFDESWKLLNDVRRRILKSSSSLIISQSTHKLSDASYALLHAKHFKELLSVGLSRTWMEHTLTSIHSLYCSSGTT
jgi:cytokinesis protein